MPGSTRSGEVAAYVRIHDTLVEEPTPAVAYAHWTGKIDFRLDATDLPPHLSRHQQIRFLAQDSYVVSCRVTDDDTLELAERLLALALEKVRADADRFDAAAGQASDMTTRPSGLTIDDLVVATVERSRYAYGPDDLQAYWARRLHVLSALLGVDHGDARSRTTLMLIGDVARALAAPVNPLSGILECPPEPGKVLSTYAQTFSKLEAQRTSAGIDMLRDLYCLLDPALRDRTVEASDLLAQGIELEPPWFEVDL